MVIFCENQKDITLNFYKYKANKFITTLLHKPNQSFIFAAEFKNSNEEIKLSRRAPCSYRFRKECFDEPIINPLMAPHRCL